MNFSIAQYKKVQHQFLQQFSLKTVDFYQSDLNQNNVIQYKKLINQIRTKKHEDIAKKHQLQVSYSKNNNKSQQMLNKMVQKNEPITQQQEAFYLTQTKQNLNSTIKSQAVRMNSQLAFSQCIQKNQNLDIQQLDDKICGQYSILQCLTHQLSQVQEGMFCFKKRLISLQAQLNTDVLLKEKQADKVFVQNNNSMIKAKYNNRQMKSALSKTRKHFEMDYQGKKLYQSKFKSQNKQQFQQSIVNHLRMKEMKAIILHQQRVINQMIDVNQELQKKEQKYKSIQIRQKEIYKIYQDIITFSKSFQNSQSNSKIVSILDKDFQSFDSSNNKNSQNKKFCNKIIAKNSKNGSTGIQKSLQKQLFSIVNEILSLYRLLKSQQMTSVSEFQILIDQRDEKEAQLKRTISKLAGQYKNTTQQFSNLKKYSQQNGYQPTILDIKKLQNKIKYFNHSTFAMQDSLRYWLNKYLQNIEKIISIWIKTDKVSSQLIVNIQQKLQSIFQVKQPQNLRQSCKQLIYSQKQISANDSKNLLINLFQNWQQYIFYLDILHQNPYINRYLTRTKLNKMFKRIIKTKVNNQNIRTDEIFNKAIEHMFEKATKHHTTKIVSLLLLFKQFYSYLHQVITGKIILSSSYNYEMPTNQKPQTQTIISNAPSINELRLSDQLNIRHSTDRRSQKWKQSKIEKENSKKSGKETLSQLKKKRVVPQWLNMDQFYQDLKTQIQNVKVSY